MSAATQHHPMRVRSRGCGPARSDYALRILARERKIQRLQFRMRKLAAAATGLLLVLCGAAWGQVTVTETAWSPPMSPWRYDIAVTNPSPTDTMWAVDFDFGPSAAVADDPPNWPYTQLDLNTWVFFSASPGVPPLGTDVPPGGTITLAIWSGTRLGEIPYVLQLEDALGGDVNVEGTAVVPEPGTLAVLTLGMAGMMKRRQRGC